MTDEPLTRDLNITADIIEGLKDPEFAAEWLKAQDEEHVVKDATIESLSRKLEEARGRIGELERELGRDDEDLPDVKPMSKEAYEECMRLAKAYEDRKAFEVPAVAARIAAFEAALTPSEETKFAYMGEVNFHHTDFDEDGNEHRIRMDVPWTSIKQLMRLIRQKADEYAARNKPEGKTI